MAISRRFLQPINLLNASADPASAEQGDVYYNTTSDKIRFYDGSQWNDVGSGGGGGVTVSETAPSNPELGDGWFKSSTSELFFWDGTFWIEATSTVENFLLFEVGSTPPESPLEGQGWFDNVNGDFYIYDGTFWQEVVNTILVDLYQDASPQLSADLDANGFGLENVDHISFDTASTYSVGEGELAWNSEEHTLDLGLGGGVTMQLGEEFYIPKVLNNSGVDIENGSFVMATGAQGDQITIAKAVTDGSIEPEYMLGIATETILNGADDGRVTTQGIVRDVDTSLWTVGTILYPDPAVAGGLTNVKPDAPNSRLPIAIVIRQHAQTGRIYVRIDIGKHLEHDLNDVQVNSPQNKDVLYYNSSTGIWENQGILSLVSSVDGSGSGLDADLLDGQHGSYYTGYTDTAIANLIDTAPETLNTLNELAAALGDDANFSTTITNSLALKAPIASPVFTGIPEAPTASSGTSTTQIATTAFVQTAIAGFEALPDQTGNSGKYLTTDGTTASWGEVVGGSGGSISTDIALSNSWWMGV